MNDLTQAVHTERAARYRRAPKRNCVPVLIIAMACSVGLLFPGSTLAEISEVGEAGEVAQAACPADCLVVAGVTGFQVKVGKTRNPFAIKANGRVVAFTLTLSKPGPKQIKFFDDNYGGAASVRLSVLRPRKKRDPKTRKLIRYNMALVAQSDVFNVVPYFGGAPTFPLVRSLRVRAGDVLALTVPTWVPAFAYRLPSDTSWRSSRPIKSCDNVRQTAIHETLAEQRRYGCLHQTARLLYTATVITDPPQTNKPPAAKKK